MFQDKNQGIEYLNLPTAEDMDCEVVQNLVINDAQSEKKRKYSKSYTEEVVQAALKDINYGMPKKQAAMKYGISRSTLQFRLSDKFTKIEHGPRTYLTRDE
ncbi:hypothetical protein JTB14_026956 [Gonioctena quinquepunctata]|nr:hypothetical protein JTB14_026956 [Gonioctena quinquepunctata]